LAEGSFSLITDIFKKSAGTHRMFSIRRALEYLTEFAQKNDEKATSFIISVTQWENEKLLRNEIELVRTMFVLATRLEIWLLVIS
jgi:hypothetical protein